MKHRGNQMNNGCVFADEFDCHLAHNGPAGLFTMTHEGELQFDLFRTRDWIRRFQSSMNESNIEWSHCVMIDSATKWPMYCLITSSELVGSDDRTTTHVFDSYDQAQKALLSFKERYFTDTSD